MKLSDDEIREVAELLESGLNVFYNLKKKEVIMLTPLQIEEYDIVINSDDYDEEYLNKMDNEFDFPTIKDIYENDEDYYEFGNMDSNDSFKLMRKFAENVTEKTLQMKLYNALNLPKPFRNFKSELEMSDSDLKNWFEFKIQGYIDYIKIQIRQFNELVENE
jgi:hypothetical protein